MYSQLAFIEVLLNEPLMPTQTKITFQANPF